MREDYKTNQRCRHMKQPRSEHFSSKMLVAATQRADNGPPGRAGITMLQVHITKWKNNPVKVFVKAGGESKNNYNKGHKTER